MKFENLRVLNAFGNPISKNPNYSQYALAHLRRLKYFDYRLLMKNLYTPPTPYI